MKCKNCGRDLNFYMMVEYTGINSEQMEECLETEDFYPLFLSGNEVLHVYCEEYSFNGDEVEILSDEDKNRLYEYFNAIVTD